MNKGKVVGFVAVAMTHIFINKKAQTTAAKLYIETLILVVMSGSMFTMST